MKIDESRKRKKKNGKAAVGKKRMCVRRMKNYKSKGRVKRDGKRRWKDVEGRKENVRVRMEERDK